MCSKNEGVFRTIIFLCMAVYDIEISRSLSRACNIWFIVECGLKKQSTHTRLSLTDKVKFVVGNNVKVRTIEIARNINEWLENFRYRINSFHRSFLSPHQLNWLRGKIHFLRIAGVSGCTFVETRTSAMTWAQPWRKISFRIQIHALLAVIMTCEEEFVQESTINQNIKQW